MNRFIIICAGLLELTQANVQNLSETFDGADNCSLNSINHFPHLPLPGGPVLSTIITLLTVAYLFLFLVSVCENYFVSTIKIIGKETGLSSDVAGATLMAAAVSSPDLFMNVIATFVTKGDIGIGTVAGCGLFNTLAIPALCVLLTPSKKIKLNSWSLTRDSIFYCASLVALTLSLTDNIIDWHEGLVLLSIYLFYITVLWQNTYLRTKAELAINYFRYHSGDGSIKAPLLLKSHSVLSYGTDSDFYREYSEEDEGFQLGRFFCKMLTFPIDIMLRLTVPKPTKEIFGCRLYLVTFILCLSWIAGISYVVAWMITIAGYELGIPSSFVGLTFIAIGMSVPEAASSVIVAKRGDGAMALSNSMGSSIFDTLICLGLPWILKSVLSEEKTVFIQSKGIEYTAVLLIVSIVIMYSSIALNKFKLNSTVGYLCIAFYALFAVFSALLEINVFFEGNLPLCQ